MQQIATKYGCSRACVSRICKQIRESGSYEQKEGRGRPRKTSTTTDRLIVHAIKVDPFITSKQVVCDNPVLEGVSSRTIRRRINESGEFASYWASRKPFLREENRKKRLDWCKRFQHKPVSFWRRVVWTDESPFVLRYSGKVRVWRMHNERYNPKYTVGTVKHDKKIMVWGCFSYHGTGNLALVDGIMDSKQFIKILKDNYLPSQERLERSQHDLEVVYQQDNDPKHTSKLTRDWMESVGLEPMEWIAQSPDLNPIENLWSILDQELKHRKPNNEAELFEILKEGWNNLAKSMLERLVDSLPRRIAAVIAVKGRMTKY